jgi:hypothetical protein
MSLMIADCQLVIECVGGISVISTVAEASCGAAIRVKPKVRLCEPWVLISYLLRAAKRRKRKNRAAYP